MGSCLPKVNIDFQKIILRVCPHKAKKDEAPDPHVDFTGGNVHRITTANNWDQKLSAAKKDGKIVVANFSASWCGPCRAIFPLYKELSEKHPSLMFLLVDVEELTEFCTSWDITATPTFFFLRNGQQFDKLVGAKKPELQQKIASIIDSAVSSKT